MSSRKGASKDKLAPKSKIHVFAMVWMQMYKNHAQTPFDYFEDPMYVGDGMEELGFSMDCGKSLGENYPEANLGLRAITGKKS